MICKPLSLIALIALAVVPAHGQVTLERLSDAPGGGPGGGLEAAISADGKVVAFRSSASNLVPGDTNGRTDIFTTVGGQITRVTVNASGAQADGDSGYPRMSADGRFVVFQSRATNLAGVPDTDGLEDIFLHDRASRQTVKLSGGAWAAQANGGSFFPQISADGSVIVYSSRATNIGCAVNPNQLQICLAGTSGTATLISAGLGGPPNGQSQNAVLSADGRYIAFESAASNLVPNDTNNQVDAFVHDRESGLTERISIGPGGVQGNGFSGMGLAGSMSFDGRYVPFVSLANNLMTTPDSNISADVYLRDRLLGLTTRISVRADGGEGTGGSAGEPSISFDGRYVAFESNMVNLVPGDGNLDEDIFVRDRVGGSTTRVSVSLQGVQGNNESRYPMLAADGSRLVFDSLADTLVPGDVVGSRDVFLRTDGVPRVQVSLSPETVELCPGATSGGAFTVRWVGSRLLGGDRPCQATMGDGTSWATIPGLLPAVGARIDAVVANQAAPASLNIGLRCTAENGMTIDASASLQLTASAGCPPPPPQLPTSLPAWTANTALGAFETTVALADGPVSLIAVAQQPSQGQLWALVRGREVLLRLRADGMPAGINRVYDFMLTASNGISASSQSYQVTFDAEPFVLYAGDFDG